MVYFVALWSEPDDVEGFEEHYRTTHMGIASRWPGVRSVTASQVTGAPLGGRPAYHLVFVAAFDSQSELDACMRSDEMREAGADVAEIGRRFGSRATVVTTAEL